MINFTAHKITSNLRYFFLILSFALAVSMMYVSSNASAQGLTEEDFMGAEETATTSPVDVDAVNAQEQVDPSEPVSAPTEVPEGSVPAPVVVEIDNNGHVLMRGVIESTTAEGLTVKSWGGTWTVRVNGGTALVPGSTATMSAGAFVGIEGQVATDQAQTVDATFVRDWEAAPYIGEGAPAPVPAPSSITAAITSSIAAIANKAPLQTMLEQLKNATQTLTALRGTDDDAEDDVEEDNEENADEDENSSEDFTDDEDEGENEAENNKDADEAEIETFEGTMSDITSDSFTLTDEDGEEYEVTVAFDTDVFDDEEEYVTDLTDLELEDETSVEVTGTIDEDDSDIIVATEVRIQ